MTMDIDISPIRSMIASRLSSNPAFMAYALTRYAKMEGLTAEQVAAELGTLPELCDRLALCRRPATDDPEFSNVVHRLADYALIDAGALANLLRKVEVIVGIGEAVDIPLQAAARDRDNEELESEE
jgi:hypothetical protein